jgi:hypothetical protein
MRKGSKAVSAAIRASLQKLNSAVQKLETSVVSVQTRKPKPGRGTPQDDLFSAGAAAQSASNVNNLNVRQLAARLDTAIDQVEKILKEGRG